MMAPVYQSDITASSTGASPGVDVVRLEGFHRSFGSVRAVDGIDPGRRHSDIDAEARRSLTGRSKVASPMRRNFSRNTNPSTASRSSSKISCSLPFHFAGLFEEMP
jgi:hypothetical protein